MGYLIGIMHNNRATILYNILNNKDIKLLTLNKQSFIMVLTVKQVTNKKNQLAASQQERGII